VVNLFSATMLSRKRVIAACGVVVVILVGAIVLVRQGANPADAARSRARPAVPVTVVAAALQDIPIYLTGLGTVQASFTVGIHSQVDGKLQEVLFTEGQLVRKGDILAKIDPRLFKAALDQAKAKKLQDQANLVAAEKDLVRFKELALKDFQTQQNVDLQQAKVDTTKAAISADDAAIETAQTQLDYTSIVAPSDGRMGVRLVDPGNIVRASDQGSIAMLMRTIPSAVLFTLPAHTLQDVRDAMVEGGEVSVVAYDRDNRRALSKGTLATVDNMIDQATATYRLKATFANEDERLWPGQFVNARLLLDIRKNAIVIPSTAVQRGPQGLFAWIVTAANTAETRPIEISTVAGDLTVVTAGLKPGEHVVTGGQYKLQTNIPVSVNIPTRSAGGS
jgi:membrane fusion protein, multidrug efflux system